MLGWVFACWAALFVLFAAVAGALGDVSVSGSAVSIARDLIVAAAVLLAASFVVTSQHRKS